MSARRKHENIGELIAIDGGNRPAEAYGHHVARTNEVEEDVKNAFSSFSYLVNDERRMKEVARLTVDIRKEVTRSIEASLKIGMALLKIKEELEEDRVMEHYFSKGFLPFKKSYASKLMKVAHDFQTGRFSGALGRTVEVEQLPPIGVAYELHTLSDDHLKTAAERGLISPQATMRKVLELKSEIIAQTIGEDGGDETRALRELNRLEKQRGKIQAQLSALDVKIMLAKKALGIQAHAAE